MWKLSLITISWEWSEFWITKPSFEALQQALKYLIRISNVYGSEGLRFELRFCHCSNVTSQFRQRWVAVWRKLDLSSTWSSKIKMYFFVIYLESMILKESGLCWNYLMVFLFMNWAKKIRLSSTIVRLQQYVCLPPFMSSKSLFF